MVKDIKSESEGRYDILQNGVGEVLVIIKYRTGGPENPRLVYDGGAQALLYRSRESAVMFDDIHVDARKALKGVSELLMVEIEDDEVAREYNVPIRHVKSLQDLIDKAAKK